MGEREFKVLYLLFFFFIRAHQVNYCKKGKLPVKTSPLLPRASNRRQSGSGASVWQRRVNKHKQQLGVNEPNGEKKVVGSSSLQLVQTVNVCTFSIRRDPLAASYNYVILLGP